MSSRSPLVYLGLGTNLGEREANLQAAAVALPPEVRVLRASSIYETEPWGFKDQPWFLNQVLEVETELDPRALLAHLKEIETQLGRLPSFRFGPRLIDLDILLYGDQSLQMENLIIPHPRLAEREFVLGPLCELAPDLRHPLLNSTMRELLAALKDNQGDEK
ncbi:MAG TPA: 2-amino-4-hydroxy-6-hydroxymethyldihydropteridine diphosphokinase [Anaerolineaceae bacterium]|nr:2-amino-4-hydroxy-6-hydroxymethyldihydropteridine diphosphokinase [Anaerolineaceae bacterium]